MGNNIIKKYVFLDLGSSGTFCSEHLMQWLNVTGKRTSVTLCTIGQTLISQLQKYLVSTTTTSILFQRLLHSRKCQLLLMTRWTNISKLLGNLEVIQDGLYAVKVSGMGDNGPLNVSSDVDPHPHP